MDKRDPFDSYHRRLPPAERARCAVCDDGCGRCVTDHRDGRPGGHARECPRDRSDA
jgi:hypothetical protein